MASISTQMLLAINHGYGGRSGSSRQRESGWLSLSCGQVGSIDREYRALCDGRVWQTDIGVACRVKNSVLGDRWLRLAYSDSHDH